MASPIISLYFFDDACEALARALHYRVDRLLPGGIVGTPDAPSTYEELVATWPLLMVRRKSVPVFNGNCDKSVYGSPGANLAFRAHHDYWHLVREYDFTPHGEGQTAVAQVADLARDLPDNLRELCGGILYADVLGQSLYHERHKRFPDDKRVFVYMYLNNPSAALAYDGW